MGYRLMNLDERPVHRIMSRVVAMGLSCACGADATTAEAEQWLAALETDPDTVEWSCGPCCPAEADDIPHDGHGCVWDGTDT